MQYEFSFDFKPTKFVGGWTNILHLTTGGNTGWGGRIPALFMHNNKVYIFNAIDGNGNWLFDSPVLKINEWVHIQMTQTFEREEYVYRVYLNEQLLKTKVNKKPEEFKEVDVWISDNWSTATHGYIKNIQLKGEFIFVYFFMYRWSRIGSLLSPSTLVVTE